MAATTLPTNTASSPSAISTLSTCGELLYDIPSSGPSCAMPYGSNHTNILFNCCASADVVSYLDDCGIYCLAQGQSVDELSACMFQNGAPWADVFCSATGNATADAAAADAPLESGASVLPSSAASETGSDDASETGSSNSSTSASAPRVGVDVGGSGFVMSALLVSSLLFGALQL